MARTRNTTNNKDRQKPLILRLASKVRYEDTHAPFNEDTTFDFLRRGEFRRVSRKIAAEFYGRESRATIMLYTTLAMQAEANSLKGLDDAAKRKYFADFQSTSSSSRLWPRLSEYKNIVATLYNESHNDLSRSMLIQRYSFSAEWEGIDLQGKFGIDAHGSPWVEEIKAVVADAIDDDAQEVDHVHLSSAKIYGEDGAPSAFPSTDEPRRFNAKPYAYERHKTKPYVAAMKRALRHAFHTKDADATIEAGAYERAVVDTFDKVLLPAMECKDPLDLDDAIASNLTLASPDESRDFSSAATLQEKINTKDGQCVTTYDTIKDSTRDAIAFCVYANSTIKNRVDFPSSLTKAVSDYLYFTMTSDEDGIAKMEKGFRTWERSLQSEDAAISKKAGEATEKTDAITDREAEIPDDENWNVGDQCRQLINEIRGCELSEGEIAKRLDDIEQEAADYGTDLKVLVADAIKEIKKVRDAVNKSESGTRTTYPMTNPKVALDIEIAKALRAELASTDPLSQNIIGYIFGKRSINPNRIETASDIANHLCLPTSTGIGFTEITLADVVNGTPRGCSTTSPSDQTHHTPSRDDKTN